MGQPPRLSASPSDGKGNRPRKVEFRQGNAVVAGREEVGCLSPAHDAADWSQSTPDFDICKCKDKICFTCSKYIAEYKFKSNITHTKIIT